MLKVYPVKTTDKPVIYIYTCKGPCIMLKRYQPKFNWAEFYFCRYTDIYHDGAATQCNL